jgi:hypothetical protein
MSDFDHIGRRPILAGIGALAFATAFDTTPARAQALDRPPRVLVFDVAETLLDVFESPAEKWSFGNGETQFFKG